MLLPKIPKQQTEQQRERKSRLIEAKLLEEEAFIKAERIMFYLAFDGEVNTKNMINKAIDLGKQVYVPLCDTENKTLIPSLFKKDTITEIGPYKTLQPRSKINLPAEDLNLVIVPAVAFDRNGNRLGRGKGYDDRFLKRLSHSVQKIGLAFDFQILPSLPIDKNDMPVNKVLFA